MIGAVALTGPGLWFWQPMTPIDWGWMLLLSVLAVLGHGLLIKAYEAAEASGVQPLTYFQLVFSSIVGITLFYGARRSDVVLGGCDRGRGGAICAMAAEGAGTGGGDRCRAFCPGVRRRGAACPSPAAR